MRSKTMAIVGVVAALHGAIIGSVFLMGGCGRTTGSNQPGTDNTAVMPPVEPEKTPEISQQRPEFIQGETKPVKAAKSSKSSKASKSTETGKVSSAATKHEGMQTYTVAKGDCLSSIAQHYGVSAKELQDLNGIAKPQSIRVGQTLYLPSGAKKRDVPVKAKKASAVAKAGATASTETPATSTPGSYTVVKGDSIAKIAHKNHTTAKKLLAANNLTSDKLKVGQKLTIPGAEAAVAAPATTPAVPAVQEPAPPIPAPDVTAVPSAAPAAGGPVSAPAMGGPAPVTAPPMAQNAGGPAPAVAAAAPAPADQYIMHEVLFGEDLNEVARKYAVPVEKLMSVNNLTDPSIKPGMVLKIPQN